MSGPDPDAGGGVAEPVGDEATTEGTGETVGEAKWAAIRELERRFPGLDKARIQFEVLSEGERGLLGVGFAPARVLAHVPPEARAAAAPPEPAPPPPGEEPGSPAARLRELLDRICAGLGVDASVSISESEEGFRVRLSGRDIGLLIGKHGQTIDAIQYLANAVLWRSGGDERRQVVVDAAGYRERRRAALERLADGAARDALQTGEPVALEPMTATERKVVHLYLQGRRGIATASEGTEPNRRIVVAPSEPAESGEA